MSGFCAVLELLWVVVLFVLVLAAAVVSFVVCATLVVGADVLVVVVTFEVAALVVPGSVTALVAAVVAAWLPLVVLFGSKFWQALTVNKIRLIMLQVSVRIKSFFLFIFHSSEGVTFIVVLTGMMGSSCILLYMNLRKDEGLKC